MIDASRKGLTLRYDQKARLVLVACALFAALAIVGTIQWAVALVADTQAEFNHARAMIAAGDATVPPEAEATRADQVLPGRSLADVQGAAQVQLKTLAERSGAGVASLHVTAGEGRGTLSEVRLQAVLSVPERCLTVLLTELASSRPLLALETFEAQPEAAGRGIQLPESTLSVRLNAVGFARLGRGGQP